MDAERGMVVVFQKPLRPERGLLIGSQIAAGGAALVAAYLELLFLKNLAPNVREELLLRCFIKRWLDDILFVIWDRISGRCRMAIMVIAPE
jgi:hypothetical protein